MKTKNFPLIVGISLPIIFIIIISVVIFAPSLFVKPEHNFIYTVEDYYYSYNEAYQNTYKVENQRIALDPLPLRENNTQTKISPTLYLYDVKADSSHQITFEEAQAYTVDPGPSSPDGYVVDRQYGHNGIFELFGSNNDDRGLFISKDSGKKKLNGMVTSGYYGLESFKLIGWIK